MKSTDAAEIKRLKKELETVRAVLRTFVIQVDSLQRENGRLTNERDVARSQLNDANTMISSLDQERAKLNDKVQLPLNLMRLVLALRHRSVVVNKPRSLKILSDLWSHLPSIEM